MRTSLRISANIPQFFHLLYTRCALRECTEPLARQDLRARCARLHKECPWRAGAAQWAIWGEINSWQQTRLDRCTLCMCRRKTARG